MAENTDEPRRMPADAEREGVARSDTDVDDLVKTLRSYGVLTRERLLDRSGGRHWQQDRFVAALRRGVDEGSIKQLGAGLFEVGQDAPDPNEGRFDPP